MFGIVRKNLFRASPQGRFPGRPVTGAVAQHQVRRVLSMGLRIDFRAWVDLHEYGLTRARVAHLLQLLPQFRQQLLAFLRVHQALRLSPLEIQIKAVKTHPVGPGLAPVGSLRLRLTRFQVQPAAFFEPTVEVKDPIETSKAVVGQHPQSGVCVQPRKHVSQHLVHVLVGFFTTPSWFSVRQYICDCRSRWEI